MATCPICGESAAEDAPICYKCGSAFVWPRAVPRLDYPRRFAVSRWMVVFATPVAAVGALVSYYGRHSGPNGAWPPALHILIPVCSVGWFSSLILLAHRRRQYLSYKAATPESSEPAEDRQPLAVPNRLILS